MCEEHPAVIMDNGSQECKTGIAGDDHPRCCFPAIVGRQKHQGIMIGMDAKEFYVGDEAQAKRGVLILKYPIENGIVTDWNDMENIWHHAIFNELRVTPEDHPFLLTERKMTQVMFETFNVPKLYVAISALLSLYSTGRTTGLVVDSGDGVSYSVPIFEGIALLDSTFRADMAGRACTKYLDLIINELESSSAQLEVVRDMKERMCYVAFDYEEELKKYKESDLYNKPYDLPDGNVIMLKNQRFRCPELLFNPSLNDIKALGLHQLAFQSITKLDCEIRKYLYYCHQIVFKMLSFPEVQHYSQEFQKGQPKNQNLVILKNINNIRLKLLQVLKGNILLGQVGLFYHNYQHFKICGLQDKNTMKPVHPLFTKNACDHYQAYIFYQTNFNLSWRLKIL